MAAATRLSSVIRGSNSDLIQLCTPTKGTGKIKASSPVAVVPYKEEFNCDANNVTNSDNEEHQEDDDNDQGVELLTDCGLEGNLIVFKI